MRQRERSQKVPWSVFIANQCDQAHCNRLVMGVQQPFFFFNLIFLSQALQRWVSMVSVRRRWKQEGQKCFVFFKFIKPKVTWGFRSLCASCRLIIALTIRSVINTKQIHIFKTVLMVRFISFRWVTYWSLNKPPSFRDNEIICIKVWYTGEASITGLSPICLF